MAKQAGKTIHTYTPQSSSEGNFFTVWFGVIRNLLDYRDLIWQLVRVDLLGQLKRSLVGIAWMIINPLIVVVVWFSFKEFGVFNPGKIDIPFPAYVLLGTSLWQFFEGTFETVSKSLTASGPMFIQAKFPHEIVIVQKLVVQLINFSIPFVLNLIVLLVVGVQFSWASLLFPIVLLPFFLLGASLGMIFSVIEVVAVDIYNGFQKLLHYLMYATPVLFSTKSQNKYLQLIIDYNPLTYLLASARDILVKGSLYEPEKYFICAGVSVIFFVVVVRVFISAEQKVVERITI